MNSRGMGEYSSKFFRFTIWLLIFAFVLPTPVMTAAANETPANAHVLRRLNNPERMRAIEEMARQDAAAREAYAQSEIAASSAPIPRGNTAVQTPAPASRESAAVAAADSPRPQSLQSPQSVTEVLFNYAAGFAGVPGLAPRQGIDGSLDEGLGFHQDGTARKAGGVAGSSGPSAHGQRANAYMRTGLNAYGQGYAPGLYDEMHYDLWGRNASTRGGRRDSGNSYSRDLGDFDPLNMALDRGLSWGNGFVNSMGEAAISGLVDGGRARLNFRLDRDGYFSGEGDALLPFYDGKYTTVYTQLGARSMHDSEDTRWIGNFGLGQRWFPLAQGESLDSIDYDAGTLMLGYNAFFDYDFTRDHQRGGVGAEVWYDWLRLGTNYYFPLSSWKGSEDFESDFVKERPAEGWDARVKAYLPFYRNVALTGAYSQWYGDHVCMFGSNNLEKDPRVWSYGIEYTPVPLVSGFITQKSTERGCTDTEFGLTFTYHFQMPWEQQISHSKVAELRTVGGSRHEFVDRENRIILEYKAKNAYRIEYLGKTGSNAFKFRLMDGLGKAGSGKTASVSLAGATFAGSLAAASFTAGGNGEFTIQLDSVSSTPVTATIQAGSNTQSFRLEADLTGGNLRASANTVANGGMVTLTFDGGAGLANQGVSWQVLSGPGSLSGQQATTNGSGVATATLTAAPTGNGPILVRATVDGKDYDVTVTIGVSYSISLSASTTTPAATGSSDLTATVRKNGVLAQSESVSFSWQIKGGSHTAQTASGTFTTNGSGETTYTLNNNNSSLDSYNGSNRTITVTASINGVDSSPVDITFGTVPSCFIADAGGSNAMTWANAGAYCAAQGGSLPLIDGNTSWDGSGSPNIEGFGPVDGSWPSDLPYDSCWTGTTDSGYSGNAWIVDGLLIPGVFNVGSYDKGFSRRVVCVP